MRPTSDDDVTAFHDYVYMRCNPAGAILEHWYHASGCRSWLIVKRDTRTHEISGAALAQEAER
jgi:sarcosine oxidase subunit delta